MRFAITLLFSALTAAAQAFQVTGLRCEDLAAPVGVDLPLPKLSWQIEDATHTRGQKQTASQILVASTAAKLAADQGDLWDSGKVASDQSLRVPYAGTTLTSRQRALWKVRVWDRDGKPSPWSAPSEWTMGLLNPSDWSAKWIAHASEGFPHPWMRRNFEVKSKPGRALVFVNTPGLFELYLNGKKVSDDVLNPAYSASIRTLRRGARAVCIRVVHVLIRCFQKGVERHILVPALGTGPVLT